MNYHDIGEADVANGLGIRTVIWLSGCEHHCKGCFNENTWDGNSGKPFDEDVEKRLMEATDKPYVRGLTLSGGDPLFSYNNGLMELLKHFREHFKDTKDIWLYSGYTFKTIQRLFPKILEYVDVIVDGRFEENLHDARLAFRGSSNQVIWEKKDGVFVRSELND